MYKTILCLVLVMGLASCSVMKKNFGTAEQTPQLKADRIHCENKSEKAVAGSRDSAFRKLDKKKDVYHACMRSKGYDRQDRPVAK